jgi:hypothetical protein
MLQVTWLRTLYLSRSEDYYGTVRRHFISSIFLSFAYSRQVPVTFVVAVRQHVSARLPLDGFSWNVWKLLKIRRHTRNLVAIGQKYRALCFEEGYCCRRRWIAIRRCLPVEWHRAARIAEEVHITPVHFIVVSYLRTQPAVCFKPFDSSSKKVGPWDYNTDLCVLYLNFWSIPSTF